jgi:hypothetical protein
MAAHEGLFVNIQVAAVLVLSFLKDQEEKNE